MSFLRSFACCWCVALVLHELLLTTKVLSSAVSSLFSPGAHTPGTSLGIAAGFLILRFVVVLLWPAALVSAVRLLQRAIARTATTSYALPLRQSSLVAFFCRSQRPR